MADGDIKYVITVDPKGAVTGIKKVDDAVGKTTTTTGKAKAAFSGMWKQVAAGIGITTAITSGISLLKNTISDTITKGREFEAEFANVTTMLDTSTVNADAFRQELMDMSPVLGDTTELARGMYQVLSASIEPAKAIAFLGEAAVAAQAGVTDTATAVDALTTVINAYGMEAEDVTAVSDIMFQTVKRGKLTYEQMAQALGTIVPVASQAGIEFEEVSAAMASLTRQGIDANTATMQLRQIMMAVLKPSQEAADLAIELGLNWSAAGLKAQGLVGFLQDMKDKTGGNVEAMTTLVPNVRALTGVMALAGEGMKDFVLDLKAMGKASGATREAFEKQMKTMDFWLKTLKVMADDMKISFYEGMVTPMKDATGSAEELAEKSKDLNDKARALGEIFSTILVPAIEDVIGQWQKFTGVYATVNAAFSNIVDTISRGYVPTLGNMAKAERESAAEALQTKGTLESLKDAYGGIKGAIEAGQAKVVAAGTAWLALSGITFKAATAVEDVTEEIEIQTTVINTWAPKARTMIAWANDMATSLGRTGLGGSLHDLSGLVYNTQVAFEDAYDFGVNYFETEAAGTMERTTSAWATFTDGLQTQWASDYGDIISTMLKLPDDIHPIFQTVIDQFADMAGQMLAKWTVNFLTGFVADTATAASTVVGSLGDVVSSAVSMAAGFSPAGLISQTLGTAIGTFLGTLMGGGGAGKRDTQLIKDHTWEAKEHLKNVVGNLDQMKWEMWNNITPNLNDMKLTLWALWERLKVLPELLGGSGAPGGGSPATTEGAGGTPGGAGGTTLTFRPKFAVKIMPQPITLELDGLQLAKGLASYTYKVTKRGLMKIHVNALVGGTVSTRRGGVR